jgi:hypothetical protein
VESESDMVARAGVGKESEPRSPDVIRESEARSVPRPSWVSSKPNSPCQRWRIQRVAKRVAGRAAPKVSGRTEGPGGDT